MLDTSMNSILFAKKLRQRQSELKAKYKKDLDKYARDFESSHLTPITDYDTLLTLV